MMTLENDILTKEFTTSIKHQQVLALVITIRMTDMLFMIGHLFPHTQVMHATYYICFSKMGHGVCLYSPCDQLCIKQVSWNDAMPIEKYFITCPMLDN